MKRNYFLTAILFAVTILSFSVMGQTEYFSEPESYVECINETIFDGISLYSFQGGFIFYNNSMANTTFKREFGFFKIESEGNYENDKEMFEKELKRYISIHWPQCSSEVLETDSIDVQLNENNIIVSFEGHEFIFDILLDSMLRLKEEILDEKPFMYELAENEELKTHLMLINKSFSVYSLSDYESDIMLNFGVYNDFENNTPPYLNLSQIINSTLYELSNYGIHIQSYIGEETLLELDFIDDEKDNITIKSYTAFLDINEELGYLSFTPSFKDYGYHKVPIYVSDGKNNLEITLIIDVLLRPEPEEDKDYEDFNCSNLKCIGAHFDAESGSCVCGVASEKYQSAVSSNPVSAEMLSSAGITGSAVLDDADISENFEENQPCVEKTMVLQEGRSCCEGLEPVFDEDTGASVCALIPRNMLSPQLTAIDLGSGNYVYVRDPSKLFVGDSYIKTAGESRGSFNNVYFETNTEITMEQEFAISSMADISHIDKEVTGSFVINYKPFINSEEYYDSCAENGDEVFASEKLGPVFCCEPRSFRSYYKFEKGNCTLKKPSFAIGICDSNWSSSCGDEVCGEGEDECNCFEDCSDIPDCSLLKCPYPYFDYENNSCVCLGKPSEEELESSAGEYFEGCLCDLVSEQISEERIEFCNCTENKIKFAGCGNLTFSSYCSGNSLSVEYSSDGCPSNITCTSDFSVEPSNIPYQNAKEMVEQRVKCVKLENKESKMNDEFGKVTGPAKVCFENNEWFLLELYSDDSKAEFGNYIDFLGTRQYYVHGESEILFNLNKSSENKSLLNSDISKADLMSNKSLFLDRYNKLKIDMSASNLGNKSIFFNDVSENKNETDNIFVTFFKSGNVSVIGSGEFVLEFRDQEINSLDKDNTFNAMYNWNNDFLNLTFINNMNIIKSLFTSEDLWSVKSRYDFISKDNPKHYSRLSNSIEFNLSDSGFISSPSNYLFYYEHYNYNRTFFLNSVVQLNFGDSSVVSINKRGDIQFRDDGISYVFNPEDSNMFFGRDIYSEDFEEDYILRSVEECIQDLLKEGLVDLEFVGKIYDWKLIWNSSSPYLNGEDQYLEFAEKQLKQYINTIGPLCIDTFYYESSSVSFYPENSMFKFDFELVEQEDGIINLSYGFNADWLALNPDEFRLAGEVNISSLFKGKQNESYLLKPEINTGIYPVFDFPPYFVNLDTSYNLKSGEEFLLYVEAEDSDDYEITYSDNSTLIDIDPFTGMINFTPEEEHIGVHEIEITASDLILGTRQKIELIIE